MVSYLTDRKQYVSFNKTSSDSLSVRYGVPQWRNAAPATPATPGGADPRGRQKGAPYL